MNDDGFLKPLLRERQKRAVDAEFGPYASQRRNTAAQTDDESWARCRPLTYNP